MNEEFDAGEEIEAGAAGAPEGAVAEPTTEDVQGMYDELGIKAPAPTGKTKGRPKAATVRAKDVPQNGDDDSNTGQQKAAKVQGKSKDAPAADSDDTAGDTPDQKGAQKRDTDGKVSDEPEEAGDGVRDTKPRAKEDAERGDEEDAELGDNGTGQEAHDKDDAPEEGKRPGKSNPEVERRFQQITAEKRAAEERAAELEKQLRETMQQQQRAQIAQEDPEYTVEDFRKVRDEEGNIHELDEDRAELAYRRWKDGYDARAEQRNAEANRQAALEQAQQEYAEKTMRQSAEALDTLNDILATHPELQANSPSFDQQFSDDVMEIVRDIIEYEPGTEPGNEQGLQPVIAGMKLNPNKILDIIKRVKAEKRALPLNGVNDTVEVRSNVNVPHSRSSDPTVNAANELMKELKINKRF